MKKIYLAMLGAIALTAAPAASAKTLAEFLTECGGKTAAFSLGYGDETYCQFPIFQSGSDQVELLADGTIRIHKLLNRYQSVDFKVVGNKLQLAQRGERVLIERDILGRYNSSGSAFTLLKNEAVQLYPGGRFSVPGNAGWYYNDVDPSGNLEGEITEMPNGAFHISFGTMYESTGKTSDYDLLLSSFEVMVYQPNSKVTDTVTAYNGAQLNRDYPARVMFDEEKGIFQITNFSNAGIALSLAGATSSKFLVSASVLQGTFKDNEATGIREFTIPADLNFLASEQTSRVSHDWYGNHYCYYANSIVADDYQQKISGLNGNSFMGNAITGRMTVGEAPKHVIAETKPVWTAQDGGELVTTVDAVIDFDDYVLWCEDLNNGNWLQKIAGTKIATEREVTLKSDIQTTRYEIPANDLENVYLSGTVSSVENPDFIDNYELYLMPGHHSSITGKEADFSHPDNGHVKAISLTQYEVDAPATAADNDAKAGDRQFAVCVPATVCGELHESGEGYEYTLFAKANYKDGLNLAPTFHALTPLTISVPTAISDLNPDAISISAGEGVIYANGYVSVYTLQGQKVYEGNAAEIAVAPGLYAVKAAGKTVKVLVK